MPVASLQIASGRIDLVGLRIMPDALGQVDRIAGPRKDQQADPKKIAEALTASLSYRLNRQPKIKGVPRGWVNEDWLERCEYMADNCVHPKLKEEWQQRAGQLRRLMGVKKDAGGEAGPRSAP